MAIAGVLAAAPALAQEMRPSLADSFRLGSPGGLLCRAQSRLTDPAFASMFDRGYIIACRDAASEVGRVYALRLGGDDPAARLDAARTERARCEAAVSETIDELGAVEVRRCTLASADVGYRVYSWRRGDTLYVAEGLGGYDPALRLALRSIVADRILPGELAIATTEMGDPAAFARVQAGTLDRDQALSEGYRRNNSGSYAEASEFFESLIARNAGEGGPEAEARAGEYLINQALQQSNLGNFAEADALYARARAIPSTNAVQLRLRRNFLALHALNQRRLDEAMAVLDAAVAGLSAMGGAPTAGAEIDPPTARAINSA
ncbi:MAG: CHAT domain-containing protein, partial [Sphingomonadaceae bacterium]|nr:CHAT domain-containing protein [Sphingomonadaceae bacterium]